MAGAATFDVTMDQGTLYTLQGYIQILTDPTLPFDSITNPYIPYDLSAYTALCEIRSDFGSPIALLSSTQLDRIGLNIPSTGWFTLTIKPEDTASWAFTNDSPDQWSGVWDILFTWAVQDIAIKPYVGAWQINRLVSR